MKKKNINNNAACISRFVGTSPRLILNYWTLLRLTCNLINGKTKLHGYKLDLVQLRHVIYETLQSFRRLSKLCQPHHLYCIVQGNIINSIKKISISGVKSNTISHMFWGPGMDCRCDGHCVHLTGNSSACVQQPFFIKVLLYCVSHSTLLKTLYHGVLLTTLG